MSKIFQNNADTTGGTPLVKINRICTGNVYAKLENRNPAMSVKCRIGASMVAQAELDGSLKPGMTIVEPTSGNTGIALAFVAAAKGYECILTMPNSMSLERRMLMKSLGAEILLTDGSKGIPAAIQKAEEHVEQCRRAVDDSDVASDHVEVQRRWEQMETARQHVETLYARWEELEKKAL